MVAPQELVFRLVDTTGRSLLWVEGLIGLVLAEMGAVDAGDWIKSGVDYTALTA